MRKLLRKPSGRKCEYCLEMPMNKGMETFLFNDRNLVTNSEAYVWAFAKSIKLPGELSIAIERCPMCGRKL